MKCPKCAATVKKVNVAVHGAKNAVTSYQCTACDYFEFDADSSRKAIQELQDHPLKIKQKVIKLSQDRLGIYFNSNIVRSLGLKSGEDVLVSVPDKKHIVVELG